MTHEQLTEIEDVGPRIAESIIEYFSVPENREIIERLRLAGLQFSLPPDSDEGGSDRLAGKSIVISGTFVHHSRDEYKALIEKHGGKNVSSISKKTDYSQIHQPKSAQYAKYIFPLSARHSRQTPLRLCAHTIR
jgi:DNA ligase (NAD+)